MFWSGVSSFQAGVQPTSMQNMASNLWRMPEPRELGVTSRKRASGSYFTQPSRVGSAQQRRQTRHARTETSRNGCSHHAVLLAAAEIPTRARSAPPGPTIDLAEEAYGVVPSAPGRPTGRLNAAKSPRTRRRTTIFACAGDLLHSVCSAVATRLGDATLLRPHPAIVRKLVHPGGCPN